MQVLSIDEASKDLAGTIGHVADSRQVINITGCNGEEVALVPAGELERLQRLAAGNRTDALFDRAAGMARLGYWQWDDVADCCTYCSPELGRIFGMSPNEYVRRLDSSDAFLNWIHPDDRARIAAVAADARKRRVGYDTTYRLIREDGTLLDVRELAEPVFDEKGRIIQQTGIVQDISEAKKVERELREREALLKSIYAQLPGTVYQRILHKDGSCSYPFISPGASDLFGVSAEDMRLNPRLVAENMPPADRRKREQAMRHSADTLKRYDEEFRYILPNGETIWLRTIADPERLDNGDVVWTGLTLDMTDKKRLERELRRSRDMLEQRVKERTAELAAANSALESEILERRETESALRKSEERFRDIVASIPGVVYQFKIDAAGERSFLYASPAATRMFGVEVETVLADPDSWFDRVHPEDRADLEESIRQSYETFEMWSWEGRFLRSDGKTVWFRGSSIPRRLDDGSVLWNGLILDVTETKHADEALRESKDQFAQVTENLPIIIGLVDRDERVLWCNRLAADWMQRPIEQIIGHRIEEMTSPENYRSLQPAIREALAGNRTETESELTYPDGKVRHVQRIYVPNIGPGGAVAGFYYFVHDITERKKAEQAMKENRDRLALIADNLPALIVYLDADERYLFVNKRCCEWYARDADQILGKRVAEIYGDRYSMFEERFRRVENGETVEFEDQIDYPDGVTRYVRATYLPHKSVDGEILGIFSLVEDVTAFRHAEERARQAQKMEAVGQLTGGVAHDFNNLLAVIIGNAEILVEDLGNSDPSPGAILRAARRGTELTQRLLAFSRRQPLDPRPVDLGDLVDSMSGMLSRTLGEGIRIVVTREPDLWPAMADAGQVESALLNLAINARDAMPGGGRLTIECRNVRLDATSFNDGSDVAAGDYTMLVVSDNGHGMPSDVLERVFEPFFTTKQVGQGTGLGLSMIYGFAKQSGGHVTIRSGPNRGTAVKLYLPRAMDDISISGANDLADLPCGKGETVLLLEDDDDVRALAVRILEGLNYRVVEAGCAETAERALATAKSVDLLLSDVVLPGPINGPDFAARACEGNPELKVLFMSGYPGEAARDNRLGDLGRGPLLKKPLDRRQLAESLSEALRN